MIISWGGTFLSVAIGTWSPSQSGPVLSEVELLPNPDNLTAVCTVLQQNGRKRSRVSASLKLSAMSEYNALRDDMLSCTPRILADGDTVNGTYYIETLGNPAIHFDGYITADITFVEG